MKLARVAIVLLAATCGWFGAIAFHAARETVGGKKVRFYQSPMHPWVKSDKPGQCTVCGMDLVPIYEGGANFDHAASDIDVMVIAEGLGYSQLFECLTRVEEKLGRKVSPTLYTPKEFQARVRDNDSFISRVLGQPRIVLLGHENDIPSGKSAKPAKNRQAQGRTS